MNSVIVSFDENAVINVDVIYNHLKKLYPDVKGVKVVKNKRNPDKKITMKDLEKYCGIVRSDIDEKLELEESRRERYGSLD
jgi:hypothetical protein